MRKHWALLVVGLAISAFALGAVACSSSKSGSTSTATQSLETATQSNETPAATTPQATGGTTPSATGSGTPGAPSTFTTVVATENPTLGTILTTFDGYTLYTFDNDTAGVSTCKDACASLWPPLVIPGTPTAGAGVSGTLDVVARDDGSMQVTLGGKPLYLFSSDSAVGDTKGDGFANGIWHVVKLS